MTITITRIMAAITRVTTRTAETARTIETILPESSCGLPVAFTRISSHYSNGRFHPVLKRNKPHYGVDYAAPTGTAIRATGGLLET